MQKPPRKPGESLLTRSNWVSIIVYASIITVCVTSVFVYCHFFNNGIPKQCNNIAFFTLAFAQLLHPLNLISAKENLFKNEITRNPFLWMAVFFCTALLVLSYYLPYTREILSLQYLGTSDWIIISVGSVAPLILIQLLKRTGLIK